MAVLPIFPREEEPETRALGQPLDTSPKSPAGLSPAGLLNESLVELPGRLIEELPIEVGDPAHKPIEAVDPAHKPEPSVKLPKRKKPKAKPTKAVAPTKEMFDDGGFEGEREWQSWAVDQKRCSGGASHNRRAEPMPTPKQIAEIHHRLLKRTAEQHARIQSLAAKSLMVLVLLRPLYSSDLAPVEYFEMVPFAMGENCEAAAACHFVHTRHNSAVPSPCRP